MSARRMRRARAGAAVKAAKRAAKSQGCTCQLEATIRPGRFAHVTIAHDPWCALLRARETASPGGFTQLLVTLDTDSAA